MGQLKGKLVMLNKPEYKTPLYYLKTGGHFSSLAESSYWRVLYADVDLAAKKNPNPNYQEHEHILGKIAYAQTDDERGKPPEAADDLRIKGWVLSGTLQVMDGDVLVY